MKFKTIEAARQYLEHIIKCKKEVIPNEYISIVSSDHLIVFQNTTVNVLDKNEKEHTFGYSDYRLNNNTISIYQVFTEYKIKEYKSIFGKPVFQIEDNKRMLTYTCFSIPNIISCSVAHDWKTESSLKPDILLLNRGNS